LGRVVRTPARLVPVALAAVLILSTPWAASAADTSGGDSGGDQPPTNPLDLAVPYFGHLEVTMPQGWTIGCSGLSAPKPVKLGCTSGGLTLDADGYAADYGTHVLTAALKHGSNALSVHYRVSLAKPDAPTGAEVHEDFPVEAGTAAYLPQNELGIACAGCRAHTPVLTALAVDPASAGSLAVTSSHLVFTTAASFAGTATLAYTITDEQGQVSEPAKVEVDVTPRGASTLSPLHVLADLTSSPVQYTIDQLVAGSAPDDLRVIGCDDPVYGTVTCVGDHIRYTPAAKPGAGDQFGFTLFSLSLGEQLHGSVTLVAPAKGAKVAAGVRLVTELPAASAASMLPIPPPADGATTATAQPGVFDPLVATLSGNR
jgi:hypothetical protein